MKKLVFKIQKYKCISAARFAFLLAPIEERIAVIAVPMFSPIRIGIAEPMVSVPLMESACRIPMDAEEL